MVRAPSKPLIAIVGATGTGKSDLAVEIARRFKGEIINSDALQLYHGLPIITNKITNEEMKGVPHHLLGCIGLEEETWTVSRFVTEALRTIDAIRARGNLPILVGGTTYYTQSLLFHDALANEPALGMKENPEKFPILDEDTHIIHAKLKEVDPIMAERWHPNDRRKIQRSLEIYLQTGKPASKLYSEQRMRNELSPSRIPDLKEEQRSFLRFEPLVFWVHADKGVLYPRLDGRVDKMIDRGLLDEVQQLNTFRQTHEKNAGTNIDQSRGIWVSIGYKELLDYQQSLETPGFDPIEIAKLKSFGVERTQAATRQYANRQIKWIRIKLLNALIGENQGKTTFLLDGSNLAKWQEDVLDPAISVTGRFLSSQSLPDPASLSEAAAELLTPKRDYDLAQRPDLWQKKTCEICDKIAVTENDWKLHVKSRAHRSAVGKKKKSDNAAIAANQPCKHLAADVVDVLESYLASSKIAENQGRRDSL